MSARPYPATDLDSAPWWEALQRHELLLQRCEGCGRYRWPPRGHCNHCGSAAWQWVPASGRGTVASWTVTHQSFGPTVDVPFVVVLVRLDEQDDILIPGAMEGPGDGSAMRFDAPVVVGFEDVLTGDDRPLTILRWRPADG